MHFIDTSRIRTLIVSVGSHVLQVSPAGSAGAFLPSGLLDGTECKWSRIMLFRVPQKTIARLQRRQLQTNEVRLYTSWIHFHHEKGDPVVCGSSAGLGAEDH